MRWLLCALTDEMTAVLVAKGRILVQKRKKGKKAAA